VLSPQPPLYLLEFEPLDGAPHRGIIGAMCACARAVQHGPGAVDVVGAPAAEPDPSDSCC